MKLPAFWSGIGIKILFFKIRVHEGKLEPLGDPSSGDGV
jgi:hypothetical protein